MEIKFIGEHMEVTPAISQYVQEKFQLLPVPDKLQQVEFRLGKMKEKQYVHFLAHVAKEDIVIKVDNQEDLYRAIDSTMEKIHRSFTKLKDKHKVHLHKSI